MDKGLYEVAKDPLPNKIHERGNLPHLLRRISSHRKALGATLSSGTAQKSRANPVVGLRLERVYGSPVLFSGVAVLFLSGSEISLLDKHLKSTYQNIQKLLPDTPRSVVHFLSGSLPGEAIIICVCWEYLVWWCDLPRIRYEFMQEMF